MATTADTRSFLQVVRAVLQLALALSLTGSYQTHTVASAVGAAANVFVSPTGSDASNGSFTSPFRTIVRAKQAVAALQQQPATANSPITVFLRAGRYALTETLEFSAADSGVSPQAPVTYQAYCDAVVEAAGVSVLAFPYPPNTATATTALRRLWNGVGDKAAWSGPTDPFLQLGINTSSNTVVGGPLTLPATGNTTNTTDISSVCVDKNGVGHTCYADGTLAPCVTGCMAACTLHVARKVYAKSLYRRFSHLFGKDLRKEEECVETCTLSCRGCERVTLSGATRIPTGALVTWTLFQTLAVAGGGGAAQRRLRIFRADLTAFLPAPASPDTAFALSTLYVNDTQYPVAGFPDCSVLSLSSASSPSLLTREFNCSFVPAKRAISKTLTVDPTAFSPKLSQWTNPRAAVVDVRPNASEDANVLFSLVSVNATKGEFVLGAGGAELSSDMFTTGFSTATTVSFRVENVFEELDAPGEWFFDPTTKMLFVIPLDSDAASVASMTNTVLEFPVLRQLVRVSGSRENTCTVAAHASSSLAETDSTTRVANLRFRHLVFSGTQLRHTDVCTSSVLTCLALYRTLSHACLHVLLSRSLLRRRAHPRLCVANGACRCSLPRVCSRRRREALCVREDPRQRGRGLGRERPRAARAQQRVVRRLEWDRAAHTARVHDQRVRAAGPEPLAVLTRRERVLQPDPPRGSSCRPLSSDYDCRRSSDAAPRQPHLRAPHFNDADDTQQWR